MKLITFGEICRFICFKAWLPHTKSSRKVTESLQDLFMVETGGGHWSHLNKLAMEEEKGFFFFFPHFQVTVRHYKEVKAGT